MDFGAAGSGSAMSNISGYGGATSNILGGMGGGGQQKGPNCWSSKTGGYIGTAGKVVGGVAGAYYGGPMGAQMGSQVGGQLGSQIGEMFEPSGCHPSMPAQQWTPRSSGSEGGLQSKATDTAVSDQKRDAAMGEYKAGERSAYPGDPTGGEMRQSEDDKFQQLMEMLRNRKYAEY